MPGEFYQKGKAEKVDIKGILDRLDHADSDLAALKALTDAVEGKLDDGTSGLTALKALIDAVEGKLDNSTTGLAALKALLDALEVKGDAIKSQTDKLAGSTPITGFAVQNWQTAESDVVSIGADDTRYKLHSLLLSIHNLVGTVITVRLYTQVNGTERKVYEQTFDASTDPPGLWIVNGAVGIHEVLRVTLQSNNAADDGKAVDYDYMLEAM